jgi:hypothetical protein
MIFARYAKPFNLRKLCSALVASLSISASIVARVAQPLERRSWLERVLWLCMQDLQIFARFSSTSGTGITNVYDAFGQLRPPPTTSEVLGRQPQDARSSAMSATNREPVAASVFLEHARARRAERREPKSHCQFREFLWRGDAKYFRQPLAGETRSMGEAGRQVSSMNRSRDPGRKVARAQDRQSKGSAYRIGAEQRWIGGPDK